MPFRTLVRFLFTATALFVVLILPWPGLRSFYGKMYRAGGNVAFHYFGLDGGVAFLPAQEVGSPPVRGQDTAMICLNRNVPPTENGPVVWTDSWLTAYLPTAKLIALILATPFAWSRRWNALFFGLILLHFFIGLRLLVLLLPAFSSPSAHQIFHPGPFWLSVLSFLSGNQVARSTLPIFMVPVLVWLLVTFRREDFLSFLGRPPPADKPQANQHKGVRKP